MRQTSKRARRSRALMIVIFVLLAILIAGLANNLFTMFHGSTDTVYHSTDVANSEPPAGQREGSRAAHADRAERRGQGGGNSGKYI